MTVDWDAGRYERVADQLLSAAQVLVDQASIQPGERTLDVGCGTGSVALLAAARGASACGVDPAPRLRDVAAKAATERGLQVAFLAGEAGALPCGDGSQDVVLSSFGLIFAPDALAAAAEISRVAAKTGRILYTAWLPGGPIAEVMRVRGEALASAAGVASGPQPFAWHSADAVTSVFAGRGFSLDMEVHSLQFTGRSVESFLDAEIAEHPAWLAARATLEAVGTFEAVREDTLSILRAANERADGFSVTSRYVLGRLTRA